VLTLIRNLKKIPGKGSCSVCFLLVISITLCFMIEIACNLSVAHCFIEVSGFFSQKPPGGSIPTARRHISDEFCSCFGLNSLAAMNSYQAARLRSRSLLMFVAISVSVYVFFCDWCEWVLLDIFLDQIGLSNCGMVRVEG